MNTENNSLSEQQVAFWDTINAFNDANVLSNVIVIGSWAEYVYDKSGILKIGTTLKTQDVDLLVPNINKPRNKVDITEYLENKGFEMRRSINGLMKFSKNSVLDIEFLVREIGRGQTEPYHVPSLNVTAQGLRHMEILSNNTITLQVRGYNVLVPEPAAYMLHKLVINESRVTDYKKNKDIESVKIIYKAIDEVLNQRERLENIYGKLTVKQKMLIDKTISKHEIEIRIMRKEGMER